MATSKVLEVLCPNGRRNKVKTTPSMAVLEVLQQTCEKFGYNAVEYDLKHQKKVLSVASVIRYLNLANNAKLEMVKLAKPRKESNPVIALQLEDGTRNSNEFSADSTLYDILVHFQNQWKDNLINPGVVCVYMRNEYKSLKILRNTTLRSMGIMSGRAAIRLSYRDDVEDDEHSTASIEQESEKKLSGTNEGPDGKKPKLEDVVAETTKPTGKTALKGDIKPSTSTQQSPTSSSTSSSRHGSAQIFSAPPRSIFPEDANPKTSIFPNDDRMERMPVAENNCAPQAPEFANFKFPDKPTVHDEDDLALDPELLRTEVRLSMPCERNTIIYVPQQVPLSNTDIPEGENFFDVTVEDVRKRFQVLSSAKKVAEETMLLTKSMRERKELEKITTFEKVPIRFQFPSSHILQALFRPLETVATLKEFVRTYLSEEIKGFEIFTAPPKHILKDNNQTLYKAKLCPASLLYVSSSSTVATLRQDYLENVKSQTEARIILEDIFKTRTHENTNDADTPTCSKAANTEAFTVTGHTNKYDQHRGAPKWFKPKR